MMAMSMTSMEPIKTPSLQTAELERLRRELLRKIVESEARRRAALATAQNVRSDAA